MSDSNRLKRWLNRLDPRRAPEEFRRSARNASWSTLDYVALPLTVTVMDHDAQRGDLDAAARQFSEFASKNAAIDIPAQGRAMVEAAATLQGQLIATESELRGLEQIYTGNNVRVRALHARVGELRRQLEKLSGADGESAPEESSLYPTIRKISLRGVTYADLYHRTKIQETIYELLTQQYELAKAQEAKEIPAVKVVDAAVVSAPGSSG